MCLLRTEGDRGVCVWDSEGGIGACLRLVFGQFLLVLIAQSGRVLPLSLYPILPSKPTLIVCNTRLATHRDTQRHETEDTQSEDIGQFSGCERIILSKWFC